MKNKNQELLSWYDHMLRYAQEEKNSSNFDDRWNEDDEENKQKIRRMILRYFDWQEKAPEALANIVDIELPESCEDLIGLVQDIESPKYFY